MMGGLLVAALFFGSMAWLVWDYRGTKAKNADLRQTLKQVEETINLQNENILISERVSNDYQATINLLNDDIKRLRLNQARCHTVVSKASGVDGSSAKPELPEGNGVRSDWLYDFAGRCEAERLKVIGLQNFINRTWEKNQK